MSSSLAVQIVLSLINNMTKPAQQAKAQIEGLEKSIQSLEKVGLRGARWGLPMFERGVTNLSIGMRRAAMVFPMYTAAAAGAATLLARTGITAQKAGAQLQAAYGGSLRTSERGLELARRIARETTMDFTSLVDVMVKLKTRGIDPIINGDFVKAIAQTAEVTGQSVEQITDQLTRGIMGGRAEGLKQLGIYVEKSKKAGEMTFQWADAAGKLHKETVKLGDVTAAAAVAARALFDKYPSNMDNTIVGQLDNIGDRFDEFIATINEGPKIRGTRQGGLTAWLTQQLKEINALLDQWGADGTLTRFANGIRDAITGTLETLKSFVGGVRSIYEAISGKEMTPEVAGKAIAALGAAIMALPALWALAPIIGGLGQIAAGLAAIAGIAGLSTLAVVIGGIGAAILLFSEDARKWAFDRLEAFIGLISRLAGLDKVAQWLNEFSASWIKTADDTKTPIEPEVHVSGIEATLALIESLKSAWNSLREALGLGATGHVSVNGTVPSGRGGVNSQMNPSLQGPGPGGGRGGITAPSGDPAPGGGRGGINPPKPQLAPSKTSGSPVSYKTDNNVQVSNTFHITGSENPKALAEKVGQSVKDALRRSLSDGAMATV